MMKAILIIIFSLFVISCSSRKTETHFSREENISKLESNSIIDSEIKIKRENIEKAGKEISKFSISVRNTPGQGLEKGIAILKDNKGNETQIPVNDNSEIRIDIDTKTESILKHSESDKSEKKIQNNKVISEEKRKKAEKSKQTERKGLTLLQIIVLMFASVVFGVTIWEVLKKVIRINFIL